VGVLPPRLCSGRLLRHGGFGGHHCLIASVSCPADHFGGPLLVNEHRHVGQRNLRDLLDSDRVDSAAVAAALGGPRGAQRLLRLTLSKPDGDLVGGYSVIV
jgi:hypothetical protein